MREEYFEKVFPPQRIPPPFEKHRVWCKGLTHYFSVASVIPPSHAILYSHGPTTTEAEIDFDLCSELLKSELKYDFAVKEISH